MPACFIKTHDRARERWRYSLSLRANFDFVCLSLFILLSQDKQDKLPHTHILTHTLVGSEKIINNASFKAAVKAQHTWRMRNWQHLAEQLVLLLI